MADLLDWFHALPAERQAKPRAGISREKEAELLAAWKARKTVNLPRAFGPAQALDQNTIAASANASTASTSCWSAGEDHADAGAGVVDGDAIAQFEMSARGLVQAVLQCRQRGRRLPIRRHAGQHHEFCRRPAARNSRRARHG